HEYPDRGMIGVDRSTSYLPDGVLAKGNQAAEKLAQAARVLAGTPIAVQLRFLQTMREGASERNTTTFFPVPIDLVAPFLTARQTPLSPCPRRRAERRARGRGGQASGGGGRSA